MPESKGRWAPRIVEDEVVALSSNERGFVVSCILGREKVRGVLGEFDISDMRRGDLVRKI